MRLINVTLTGADDSIRPEKLVELSEKYPFVEWGILLSPKNRGVKRFPSKVWLDDLASAVHEKQINLSAHLCGGYARDILMAKTDFISDIGGIWTDFDRVQINTHGELHNYANPDKLAACLKVIDKEIIFQFDNVNRYPLGIAIVNRIDCSMLFDLSHGAGVLPDEWPEPISNIKCGYAGGLSPDNIETCLDEWDTGGDPNQELWVDMETHLRSNNDEAFDLDKAGIVLEKSKMYIFDEELLDFIP